MNIEGIDIRRECHACFRVKAGGKTAYFDPYKIKSPEKADIILISHEHSDHFSLEDIRKVFKEDSFIFINPVTHPPLLQLGPDINNLVVMGPGEKFFGDGFTVETVLAYNTNKFRSPGRPFHPKDDERIGFILTIGGKRIYHAGDSDFTPEMAAVKTDIALLPVSGTYVMTAEEAAEACKSIKPTTAIPMHYGDVVGTEKDAEEFKKLAGCHVVILEAQS